MILSNLGQENPQTIEKKNIENFFLLADIDGSAIDPDCPEKMAQRKSVDEKGCKGR